MTPLEIIQKAVETIQRDGDYYIPAWWNRLSTPFQKDENRPGEIIVDPCRYYGDCIKWILQQPQEPVQPKIDGSVMYSMMPRAFTAWRHGRDGQWESGTFLKCIALLPRLKQMGVDLVYLLPIFLSSCAFGKGELPSPYCIQDILSLDPALGDPLISQATAEQQFAALIEACHRLGMRVALDFVFRTAARDNVMVREHPDWFYWIKAEYRDNLQAPGIPGAGHQVVSPDNVDALYQSPEMARFVKCFVDPPEQEQWNQVIQEADRQGRGILDVCMEALGICTLTGFADTINDPQPPWTDITYLKFYFDPSPAAQRNLPVGQLPPFLAQDGVKCSVFEGKQPNRQLWETIAGVIPHYITQYGLDGARIDMGHALPAPLYREIVRRIKACKPDFLLWSEEFSPQNASRAARDGNHFITGDLWEIWKNTPPSQINRRIAEGLRSVLPVTAAVEMADTPRAPLMAGGEEKAKAIFRILSLLPNNVLLINNGQELGEIQPMNLGLCNDENGRFVLPPHHPMYGRLAFFDQVQFDWINEDISKRVQWMSEMTQLRHRFAGWLQDKDAFCWEMLEKKGEQTVLLYRREEGTLAAVVNRGPKMQQVDFTEFFPEKQRVQVVACDGFTLKGQDRSGELQGFGFVLLESKEETR
nr:alpha-amylase family glycosyl hydrolase [uncultured Solibaculum sp.]